MFDFLKKLSPTHEPVAYLYVLLVGYQIIFQHQPVPDNWIQYLAEFVAGLGVRQSVKPLAKINQEEKVSESS